MKRILAFAGKNKSGKTRAADIVKDHYPEALVVPYSGSLRAVLHLFLEKEGGIPGTVVSVNDRSRKIFQDVIDMVYGPAGIRGSADPVLCHLARESVHLEESRHWTQTLSTALRQTYGADILFREVHARIVSSHGPVVILEGVRRPSDIAPFVGVGSHPDIMFFLCYVDASLDVRWRRSVRQSENVGDTCMTRAEFESRDNAEAEQAIPLLREYAHQVIMNEAEGDGFLEKAVENFIRGTSVDWDNAHSLLV